MFGCLGNLVRCLPPRRWRPRRHHEGTRQFIWGGGGGGSSEQVLKIYVLILSDNVNCRNYEYYTDCDISMCCNMDLIMYSNINEDCVVNSTRDKCWIVWPVSKGHRLD